MSIIIILIFAGILLLLAEILIIPGIGVAGVMGLLALGGSSYYAFAEFGNVSGATVTAVNVILVVVLTILALRSKTWDRLALKTNIDSKSPIFEDNTVSVGDEGKTFTRLAPMGTARINEKTYQVKSLDGIIDPNVDVVVVMLDGNKICVRVKE